mgnify:CR=1 FL=1
MAKLFWLQPDSTIIEFPLKAEQNLIGRSSRCDVRIKHPGISSEHAVIRQLPSSAILEDLGSTNGTRVNGKRVEVHTLRHGDQIGVGRERLMYFAELDEASRFVQPESTEPFAQPAPGGERVNTAAPTPQPPAPQPPAQPPAAALLAPDLFIDTANTPSLVPARVPARAAPAKGSADGMPEIDETLLASLPKGTTLASGSPVARAAAPIPAAASKPAATPAPAPAPPASPAPPPLVQRAQAPRGEAAKVQNLSGSLAVLSGPAAGKRYPLDQPSITVGKEGKQVVEFVRASPTRWQVRQREGVTPAYINGDALAGARDLAAGDVIELIGVRLRFEISLAP